MPDNLRAHLIQTVVGRLDEEIMASAAAWVVRPSTMWETPAQHVYNTLRTPCPRCFGRGSVRADGNMGCTKCGGVGSV